MTLRDFFERYGVTLTLVSILAIVLAILPGNAPQETVSDFGPGQTGTNIDPTTGLPSDGDTITNGPGGQQAQGGGGGGASDGTIEVPKVAGASVEFGKGDCDPRGREKGLSLYSPPCVLFKGDNGGTTARGVTKDKITIVRWMGQVEPATQAILEANKLADDPERRTRSYNAILKYNNQHSATYGREVVLKTHPASGPSEDDRAMRADAIKIAETHKAF
ncbi:MAG: hypothetical protein WD826_05685, partial [Actinomycetota bacterium]